MSHHPIADHARYQTVGRLHSSLRVALDTHTCGGV